MKYAMIYAKMADDKDLGSLMVGVYFGGIHESKEAGDTAARDATANPLNGTIIPKLFPLENEPLQKVMKHAMRTFEKIADNIYESERAMR